MHQGCSSAYIGKSPSDDCVVSVIRYSQLHEDVFHKQYSPLLCIYFLLYCALNQSHNHLFYIDSWGRIGKQSE